MSRIVSGDSPEVQGYIIGGGGSRTTAAGRAFHTGKVEGTYSQVEIDKACERAKQEGRREGAKEAEKKISAPLTQALQNLEQVLDEVSKFRGELFREAEEEAISLIRFIAKKIIGKELTLDPELVKQIVMRSFEIVEREKQIHIIYSAKDHQVFTKYKEDFLAQFGSKTDLRLTSDPAMEPGQIFLKTETVQLDLSVDTMVNQLLETVAQSKMSDREVDEEPQGEPT